jgi:hypothetical protein
MDPNDAFKEYKKRQEQIKQMCIDYINIYVERSKAKVLLKFIEENSQKLKFYIDEQGIPKFQDA